MSDSVYHPFNFQIYLASSTSSWSKPDAQDVRTSRYVQHMATDVRELREREVP